MRAFLIKHELDINVFVILNCSFGTSTNIGHTKVGRYKGCTVQMSDVQPSDWDKRRSSKNVGPVQTLDGYICKEKRRSLGEVVKTRQLF